MKGGERFKKFKILISNFKVGERGEIKG